MTDNDLTQFERLLVETLENTGRAAQLQLVGLTAAKNGNFDDAPEHIKKAAVDKVAESEGVEVIPERYYDLLGDEWEPEEKTRVKTKPEPHRENEKKDTWV